MQTDEPIKIDTKKLPMGAVAQVAKDHSVSRVYVYRVINGEREDFKVINALLEKAEEHKRKREEIKARINAL